MLFFVVTGNMWIVDFVMSVFTLRSKSEMKQDLHKYKDKIINESNKFHPCIIFA